MQRDWVQWHSAYDDPDSSLSRRLSIVQRLIRDAVDTAPSGPIRMLSLCAGDARDIAGALKDHPRAQDISGELIELDARLVQDAQANVAAAGVALDARCGDAADTEAFASVVPVDVLLLVGIFGNVTEEDVATTIRAVPAICRSGATVIWTRHRREPDLTPRIRQWFEAANCSPIDFFSPGPASFADASERFMPGGPAHALALPARLFTFRDDLGFIAQRLRTEATGAPLVAGSEVRIPMAIDGQFWVEGKINGNIQHFAL